MIFIFLLYFAILNNVTPKDISKYNRVCPNASEGTYPNCICYYAQFDPESNECINNKCPTKSTGTYPHCKCTEKNFDFNQEVNICFRVCPENSTGYFPNCICDDKNMGFDKYWFECITCPAEAKNGSIHPNCDCSEVGTYAVGKRECNKCMEGTEGIYPNCVCNDSTATYNQLYEICEHCPIDSTGKVPNCVCPNGEKYTAYNNECLTCVGGFYDGDQCKLCPSDSKLVSDSCVCDGNATYNKAKNECFSCPERSTGKYPDCNCFEKAFGYNLLKNKCFECPSGTIFAKYPSCQCKGTEVFSLTHHKCMKCPRNSTGTYPNCKQINVNTNYNFNAYLNQFIISCPDNTIGIHPGCDCTDDNYYYDETEKVCKLSLGRKCPELSIGIGPNCRCIKKEYAFVESLWGCFSESVVDGAPAIGICPDLSQQYPMCDVSIVSNKTSTNSVETVKSTKL